MQLMQYRNKNKDKTLIDWDLNIFMPEEYDESFDDYFFDPASWRIHVFVHKDGDQTEWDEAVILTAEEICMLGLNKDPVFKDNVDSWYGLAGFRLNYWHKLSDRLKLYFDSLPKYWEDLCNDFDENSETCIICN